jgi:hypothetical protein
MAKEPSTPVATETPNVKKKALKLHEIKANIHTR